MAPDDTASGSTEETVMTGKVTGSAANQGAFDAPFRVGRYCHARHRQGDRRNRSNLFHRFLLLSFEHNAGQRFAFRRVAERTKMTPAPVLALGHINYQALMTLFPTGSRMRQPYRTTAPTLCSRRSDSSTCL